MSSLELGSAHPPESNTREPRRGIKRLVRTVLEFTELFPPEIRGLIWQEVLGTPLRTEVKCCKLTAALEIIGDALAGITTAAPELVDNGDIVLHLQVADIMPGVEPHAHVHAVVRKLRRIPPLRNQLRRLDITVAAPFQQPVHARRKDKDRVYTFRRLTMFLCHGLQRLKHLAMEINLLAVLTKHSLNFYCTNPTFNSIPPAEYINLSHAYKKIWKASTSVKYLASLIGGHSTLATFKLRWAPVVVYPTRIATAHARFFSNLQYRPAERGLSIVEWTNRRADRMKDAFIVILTDRVSKIQSQLNGRTCNLTVVP
ncbi:hypothetical protein BU16DRAFT_545202 [Lophium mytilinum]|uniref:Uncharacterized protein n=1 Tax=Lophium mytilinum TaxID=390894 RepID=A0A6A6Q8I3_9PEZI|nr:hypothetical protein BU16DRAFT_545202 [Lophium mytilinum]